MTEENIASEFEPTKIKIASSGGKTFSQIQKDADSVIEKKTTKFIKILQTEVNAIRDLLQKYDSSPQAQILDEVHKRVHNLRGQGTLFNYPLVTEVGGCFCTYIGSLEEGELPRKEVVQVFLHSMLMIQSNDIKGEGRGQILELMNLMKQMVNKLMSS